ncbi:MAG: thioester reductase domain protein [Caulobacter sp.]|nr:thioester reductase domain protein [Caulobacter sp.]
MNDVVDRVEAKTAEAPDALLYSFLDSRGTEIERLTRGEFFARAMKIATHLRRDLDIAAGGRVLLAYPPGLEMICAFFGCAYAGLIPVPTAPPTAHGAEAALLKIAYVARDCSPAGVLSTTAVCALVAAQENRRDALQNAAASLRWIATDGLPDIPVDPGVRARSPIFFLQYTSGSTSAPKGVMVTHDNILANAAQVVDHSGNVGVSWLPQHHDMGLIGYYINNAIIGGTLYGFSPSSFIQRPALWLESITKYRATATSAPNFALEYCLRPGRIPAARMDGLDLSSLQFLMAAAEPVKPAIYEAFMQEFGPRGLRREAFVVAYGLAENTLAVSSHGRRNLSLSRQGLARGQAVVTRKVSDVRDATHLISCGRPLGDNVVRIVDPESLAVCEPHQVGEIWVTGASRCAGYWDKPELTQQVFGARLDGDDSLYLRTGDMGFLRDGELFVCGRRKDMIIVRGQNIYPQDIEAVVEAAAPAVRAGGVAAFEQEALDGVCVTVVAEVAGATLPDGVAVLAAVRRQLGLDVDRIVFVPGRSVPKTSSGKVMRFRARELLAAGELQMLAETWSPRLMDEEAKEDAFPPGPFEMLRKRYRLRGDETISLSEAGLDSLDLVNFLHELVEFLSEKGAADLAEAIDFKLVQHLSVAEIFRLVARMQHDPLTAHAQLSRLLAARQEDSLEIERSLMSEDRKLAFTPPPAAPIAPEAMRSVLFTGATGFLGPFLLKSLLEETDAQVHALVRAGDENEGAQRLWSALKPIAPELEAAFRRRVVAVPGDLAAPGLGLRSEAAEALARDTDTILHNGALVNYLFSYGRMRAPNVGGTNEVLKLAFECRRKIFNYVSTTFIFGWATKDVLLESDDNGDMELLDFGYSQSKWAAEQVVLDARRQGLPTRIFRPALVTPSLDGGGEALDITLRILAFMIRHGISVRALNQVSFVPADVTAQNIVAISRTPESLGKTFHVTRDLYVHMGDVMDIITCLTGRRFEFFDLADFVPEVIRRCTPSDPLFPLLDFLVGSIDNISSMEFKRYDNSNYQEARAGAPGAVTDPSLELTVVGILQFLKRHGLADLQRAAPARAPEAPPAFEPG